MREIRVWGATHTDEGESQALIRLLRKMARRDSEKLPVVASFSHCRNLGFYREGDNNLVRGFPGKDMRQRLDMRQLSPRAYVQTRAWQIERYSRSAYGTIDVHQIKNFGARTALIDVQRGVSPIMLGFLRGLGIDTVIGTQGWGMQGHIKNAMILESRYRHGDERQKTALAIRELSRAPNPPTAQAEDFTWYAEAGDPGTGRIVCKSFRSTGGSHSHS